MKSVRSLFTRLLETRHGGILLFATLFVGISTAIRLAFFFRSADAVAWNLSLPAAFVIGFLFDLAIALFFAVPLTLLVAAVPSRAFSKKGFRILIHGIFIFSITLFLFGAFSEWTFWNEFYVRFNFIAVDYLIYTVEVVNNITQSYNMPLILSILGISTLALYALIRPLLKTWLDNAGNSSRWPGLAAVLAPNAAALVFAFVLGASDRPAHSNLSLLETLSQGLRHMPSLQPSFSNAFNTEIAKNGEYSLFAAFWSNQLGYDEFYKKLPDNEAYARLRKLLQQDNATFLSDTPSDISRRIAGTSTPRRLNVIQITIESLSAEYLGCYKQAPYSLMGLTPNLDRLSTESVWFKNFYATGTRTVRGMESLILSVPPTPGQSVLRRPNNENLFTLGSVFKNAGYDTAFLYGGSGFFDNMNYFFANNGFRIIDRNTKVESEHAAVTFENAWGVCDEDLLDWTLAEADRAYAKGKNFYHFVMSTSNHRPFTWPDGRINIPSGTSSREGGVKYTDYAIGRFLAQARTKPWFNDTVFVIVADHCASVAGKQELEVRKYEIPLFIYSPANFKPRAVPTLASQIDYAPTLLGLLDWTYQSKFLGRDILRPSATPPRAFISNYQKIALLENDSLAVLKPVSSAQDYDCNRNTGTLTPSNKPSDDSIIHDTIAYYQCASQLLAKGRQKDFDSSAPSPLAVDMARRPASPPPAP